MGLYELSTGGRFPVTQAQTRKLRIAVIGAGMAGILATIRIRQQGVHDVVVYEKADRIGGTWRENTYPGLNCDVPAHAYTYSFAPNPDWSSFLAPGPEIQQYFESVVQKHAIESLIRFGQSVDRCEYRNGQWHLETASGIRDTVDVVIAATGVLHHPNIPQIEGMETFKGAAFHTARWDHSVPLDGRRIGVIGSGSTGVQIVSALAGRAEKVVHIQRTPQWIMPMPNDAYTDEQRAMFRENPAIIDEIRYGEMYTALVHRFTEAIIAPDSPEMAEIEAIVKMNLENSITDPVLREKLRPNYRAACKRLIYSPDYYQAIQKPGVQAAVGKIARIEPNGVRMADGTLYELDVIALATGFHADRFVRPMTVTGENGADLNALWGTKPVAYLGMTIPEFPNLFMINGPTGPVGNFSLIDIAERQWGYIEQLIAKLADGVRAVSVKSDVLNDYNRRRIKAAKKTIFGTGCNSWYLDSEGVPSSWPWSYKAFAEQTAAPRLEEFEFHA